MDVIEISGLRKEYRRFGRFLLARAPDFPFLQRSTLGAGLYLTAVACLVLLIAAIVFRTRDAT